MEGRLEESCQGIPHKSNVVSSEMRCVLTFVNVIVELHPGIYVKKMFSIHSSIKPLKLIKQASPQV